MVVPSFTVTSFAIADLDNPTPLTDQEEPQLTTREMSDIVDGAEGLKGVAEQLRLNADLESARLHYREITQEANVWRRYLKSTTQYDNPLRVSLPSKAASLLHTAIQQGCFKRFAIWSREGTKEAMLVGVVATHDGEFTFAIAAWCPAGKEFPSLEMVRDVLDKEEAEAERLKAEKGAELAKRRELAAAVRRRARPLAAIGIFILFGMMVYLNVEVILNLGWWCAIVSVLFLGIPSGFILCGGNYATKKTVIKSVLVPLAIVVAVVSSLYAAAYAQWHPSNATLTVCELSPEESTITTLSGDTYKVSNTAYNTITDATPDLYLIGLDLVVKAKVEGWIGTHKVMSVDVIDIKKGVCGIR